MKIQGENYNDAQLFLMSKLETEVLPKARIIIDAYEIAEWMEEYAKISQQPLTDEEIEKAAKEFQHDTTTSFNQGMYSGFIFGAIAYRDGKIK
jgi:hypothetical protein